MGRPEPEPMPKVLPPAPWPDPPASTVDKNQLIDPDHLGDEALDTMLALWEQTSGGPWHFHEDAGGFSVSSHIDGALIDAHGDSDAGDHEVTMDRVDARFIAEAWMFVPQAIHTIKRLRAAVRRGW